MRRWLCVLLLVLLPFQFSWAAVVGYCAHEVDTAPTHSGHHQHEHARADASAQKTSDASAKTTAPSIDLDCGHCHALCVVVSAVPDEPPALHGPGHAQPWSVRGEASHLPAPPDRPQWPALA